MITVKTIDPEKNQCNSCGKPANVEVGVSTYPQFVTNSHLCTVCAAWLLTSLGVHLDMEGYKAHAASFGALQRISEMTHLHGEVDDYEAVVDAVRQMAEGLGQG